MPRVTLATFPGLTSVHASTINSAASAEMVLSRTSTVMATHTIILLDFQDAKGAAKELKKQWKACPKGSYNEHIWVPPGPVLWIP